MIFCALQTTSSTGISWTHTIGGLVIVFALLMLSLRLLGRFHRSREAGKAEIVAVWPMGPKREIQLVKLFDTVHYIYKNDGSLVELRQHSLAEYQLATRKTEPNLVKSTLAFPEIPAS